MRAAIRLILPLPRVRSAAWAALVACAAPGAWAKAPGTTPPPRRAAAPAVNTSSAVSPAAAPDSAKPVRAELPAVPQAPSDGPLSRHDLIQLAIQAHPDFWRFRGEVAFYLQAEQAAYDWKDPELRIGYDHEFESDLSRQYEESRSINTTERGIFDINSSSYSVANDGSGDLSGILQQSTSQRERVTQTRNITTETVRKITPGKYEDIIDETVYEVERRNQSSRQSQSGPGNGSENQRSEEFSRRRVVSRSREHRTHPNDVYGDDQFTVQARLFFPNPWEVKALAARARAEAHLSSKRLRAEVRDLVFDVGRRYDELQFRYAWHQANKRLSDLEQRNLKTAEEEAARMAPLAATAGVANLYDQEAVPKARLEINKAREEVFDSGRAMALVREELALLCGLKDPSRIVLTNALRLRKISEDQLDLASLVELARAHRPELGEMKARSDIERARLREVKALRVPWINDLRVGVARTNSEGYRDQDEFTALLTMNLPLLSWWQNKSHRQHEEAIANFEEAQNVLGQRIDSQVAFAIRAVREAAAALAEFSAGEKLLHEALKKNDADAAAAGDKGARIRLSSEEALIKSGRGRLQALYHYNQAVAHLELAIGVPIEEAFAPSSAKAPSK